MAENDFLAFAAASGANVISQSSYAGSSALVQDGFIAGVAQSAQVNKVLRQSSIIAAMIAQFIVDKTGQNVIDDGTIATIENNFGGAVNVIAQAAASAAVTALVDGSTSWLGTNDFTGGASLVITQPIADNSTKSASTAFVHNEIATLPFPAPTQIQYFPVGNATWTAPATYGAGVAYAVYWRLRGGGGGGGGCAPGYGAAGGGGAGEYREGLTVVSPGASVTVAIGTGGTGGTPGNNGGNGQASTLSGAISATAQNGNGGYGYSGGSSVGQSPPTGTGTGGIGRVGGPGLAGTNAAIQGGGTLYIGGVGGWSYGATGTTPAIYTNEPAVNASYGGGGGGGVSGSNGGSGGGGECVFIW